MARHRMCSSFFLVYEGMEDPNANANINGPARETPFKWCFNGMRMMAQH